MLIVLLHCWLELIFFNQSGLLILVMFGFLQIPSLLFACIVRVFLIVLWLDKGRRKTQK